MLYSGRKVNLYASFTNAKLSRFIFSQKQTLFFAGEIKSERGSVRCEGAAGESRGKLIDKLVISPLLNFCFSWDRKSGALQSLGGAADTLNPGPFRSQKPLSGAMSCYEPLGFVSLGNGNLTGLYSNRVIKLYLLDLVQEDGVEENCAKSACPVYCVWTLLRIVGI